MFFVLIWTLTNENNKKHIIWSQILMLQARSVIIFT